VTVEKEGLTNIWGMFLEVLYKNLLKVSVELWGNTLFYFLSFESKNSLKRQNC
jgi:hypothetical protein